ncbi:MAG: TRAP transporter small permease subunit [Xanthobacteraceae bacterium]|nr:TRAP transporter small permease subunit [Xanthobacteraceae bacterium]
METLFRAVDGLSEWLGRLAMLLLVALVCAMLYEVFMRYVVGRPTEWAFDISYMLNGALFYLAAGYAMRHNAHVRIDFLSSRLPEAWQARILGVALTFVFVPVIGLVAWATARKALTAYLSGAVEEVSPWAPRVWPFYSAIALGLAVFALQSLVEGLRFLASSRLPRQATTH